METQNAQCTIQAGEVRASAQASTSKKLEGICGTKELRKSFEKLENKLMNELYVMKLMIAQLQYPRVNILPNYLNAAMRPFDINPNKIFPDLRPPAPSNYNYQQTSTGVKPTGNDKDGEPIFFPSEINNRFENNDGSSGFAMKNMESTKKPQ